MAAVRVFVAGATGVLGRRLVPLLVEAGHDVTGMTRSPEKVEQLQAMRAEAVVCDALDAAAVRRAIVAARPEAVLHQLTQIPKDHRPRRYPRLLAATDRLRTERTRNLGA